MKLVELSNGGFAMVDDDDFDKVNKYRWAKVQGYARTFDPAINKVSLHRFIMEAAGKDLIDHVDMNPLNNSKANLRRATRAENARNRGLNKNNSSGFKGVCWYSPLSKWHSYIMVNRIRIHLGYFYERRTAALKYNEAAKKYFGEFARLNDLRGLLR